MENTASNNTNNPSSYRQIVLNEVRAKWNKFSNQELSTLRRRDDLVTQVQAKYSLDKEEAERDVDALLKGSSARYAAYIMAQDAGSWRLSQWWNRDR